MITRTVVVKVVLGAKYVFAGLHLLRCISIFRGFLGSIQ